MTSGVAGQVPWYLPLKDILWRNILALCMMCVRRSNLWLSLVMRDWWLIAACLLIVSLAIYIYSGINVSSPYSSCSVLMDGGGLFESFSKRFDGPPAPNSVENMYAVPSV